MDANIFNEFVEESIEHLADIETQLVQIEAMGEMIDDNLVNVVFRSIHSIKGAAGFLGLEQINRVSHSFENVLGKVREHGLIPDPYNVDVMLQAADRLRQLIENIEASQETDNADLCQMLDAIFQGADAKLVLRGEVDLDAATNKSVEHSRQNGSQTPDPNPVAEQASAVLDSVQETIDAELDGNSDLKNGGPDNGQSKAAGPAQAAAANKPTAEVPTVQRSATVSGNSENKIAANQKPEARKNENKSSSDATVRVSVKVLDRLMNLAGELVLSRNRMLRTINENNTSGSGLDEVAGGLDQVTTELQETIMQTRMQPIGNVFNKFPRVIRDLSSSLGKSIQLTMEGNEVETDKTIVEAIADPLTHLVRNSCDHGIERPETRVAAGKPEGGTIQIRAYHQAGKVMIEICDDGAGIDPEKIKAGAIEKGILDAEAAAKMSDRDAIHMIFAPGFSTAAEVTDVSGRGVGMDVVRTNIEKIGGSVEVTSQLGAGSKVEITLPLTLAIVPSMIVSVAGQQYALPQSGIIELVQTDGREKSIQRANHSEVLRLRGSLLPLVRLRKVLGQDAEPKSEQPQGTGNAECQMVVLEAGRSRFALAVDSVEDSEEIVVKPLGRHLSHLPLLAGSTILGDGRVALILDAAGIASHIELSSDGEFEKQEREVDAETDSDRDVQRLILMSLGDADRFAISMDIVSRIERIERKRIEALGDRSVLQYRGGTLPLIRVDDVLKVGIVDEPEHVFVIVFKVCGREVGLIAPHLHDIRNCDLAQCIQVTAEIGVAAVAVIDDHSTRVLDLYGMTEHARPDWFEPKAEVEESGPMRLLVCEDSSFFRNFLSRFLTEEGHDITEACDGEDGWRQLDAAPTNFDLLITDVEMPELDGFGLTRRVRADSRMADMPIIALTSLADEESTRLGREAGVSDYQVKMNKPELTAAIRRLSKRS
ncbi:MAG: chemotaxis protein CheW [Planctomycetota bacterium]